MARQAVYLARRFPDRKLGFSLPRIREAPGGFVAPYPVDDELFVRMYCALRLAFPTADLVLSTREPPEMRNRLSQICITQISAGSSTSPGGYDPHDAAEPSGRQFPISDDRTPAEVAAWLGAEGFRVAWDAG
jgi:2-iminoacetate synthase